MSAHHRAGHEDGLSLVEMMVGMLILGLVLAALASSLVTSLRAVRGQESTTQATAAINDILEEAQRIDYDAAVLCSTTADAVFGPSGTFETEELIVSSSACGPDEVPAEQTVSRDGRDYTVTTAITWADDPGDNDAGGNDADGTQDVKRVTVDIEWTTDGRVRTARNMAFRAPQFLEQLVTVEVVSDDGDEFITIADDDPTDRYAPGAGENNEPFTVRAHAREQLTSIEVRWVDRNGVVESHPLTETSPDVWEFHLGANFGPFANGGTVFDIDATAASGDHEEVGARGLFLYDPMQVLDGVGAHAGQTIQRNFEKIRVNSADGSVCPGQSLWVDVQGAIRSDVAQAVWLKGPDPATPDSLSSVEAPEEEAKRGARFLLDLSERTDFATDNGDGTYSVPSLNQVRVSVNRIVDSSTIDKELENIHMELVPTC